MPSFEQLAPDARGYLRLLDGLEPLELSANEAAVVARIARFVDAPPVIDKVTSVAKWYARWEIREALYQNPHTPEPVREPLGLSIAVIDLMREMEATGLEESARAEIRDDIRSLLLKLPEVDRDVVKAHAHTLTSKSGGGALTTAEERAAEERAAEEATAVAAREASTSDGADRLRSALLDPRERVRRAALDNPRLDEAVLLAAAADATDPVFLSEIVSTPRWSHSDAVRRAVAGNDSTPAPTRELFATTDRLLLQLGCYFNEPLEQAEHDLLGKEILGEIQELPDRERDYVKAKVGSAWTPFLGEVTAAIEREVLAARPTPVIPARPRAPERPAVEVEPIAIERETTTPPPSADVAPPGTVARRTLGRQPLEERMLAAGTTADREELAYLLHDPDDRVFARLLDNPNVSELDVVGVVRMASRERIRRVTEHRRLYALGAIKIALLHNPNTPEPTRLECLGHVSAIRELMAVIRDPKVRSLDAKAKARTKIQERYRAMTADERAATIRQTGGSLLDDLWSNAYADEGTLRKLIADHGLEEPLLLKIARSRTAPRSILQAMGRNPRFVARYPVCLELALNPKTPRETVVQLVPRLTPADRKRLKQARGVADFVSGIA